MNKQTRINVLASMALVAPLAFGAAAQAQVYQISMPLGGTSGTFYTQGAALADFINARADGIRVVPSTSGGSVENIRLVGSGQAEFGMAFEGHIYGAWSGVGFEKPYTEYRMVGPAQQTSGWNFIVLADSDIQSVADLAGREFVPGAPGSGSASDADLFLEHIGVRDQIDISYYSWGELGRMLTDGDIEGFNRTGGAPAPFATEIDATHPIRVLDLEAEIDESGFLEEFPFFTKLTIPAGTYSGQEEDAVTYAQGVQWIVHKDVPDEAVREFLELAYTEDAAAHLDRAFPQHDHRNMEWLKTAYVPLHPAAAAFWAEKGLEVPEPVQQ
ncbi:TAXI family TRAP transporter solute-binding subunit [Halovulum dunhuangense]|uniref:TAXI family TRAP transporter solute-binding subunit n=1 Tax=Halovulum dunhuangense TaxID=1505036 RepID=A0A849L7J2_9RHOB|nr:TAXI family TRAP transporter solute-binding subunit [Halovulum dunhuangense]NNU82027.1 TAXI family TRAP transporter solute-binding subunit [Halovulum dunhuangense]